MNLIGIEVCEICGTQSIDHSGWFSIDGAGSRMEITPWDDSVPDRSASRHACCGDHLQKLVFSSAQDCTNAFTWFTPDHRGGWNASALMPVQKEPAQSTEESLMSIINEIDAVLLGATAEEEEQTAFDA